MNPQEKEKKEQKILGIHSFIHECRQAMGFMLSASNQLEGRGVTGLGTLTLLDAKHIFQPSDCFIKYLIVV